MNQLRQLMLEELHRRNFAETTIRTFNAARSLGIPVLFTDHVTNAEASNGEAKKPFGSAYTWNLARSVWTIRSA